MRLPMGTVEAPVASKTLWLTTQCSPPWVKSGQLDSSTASYHRQAQGAMVQTLERREVQQRQLPLFGSTVERGRASQTPLCRRGTPPSTRGTDLPHRGLGSSACRRAAPRARYIGVRACCV